MKIYLFILNISVYEHNGFRKQIGFCRRAGRAHKYNSLEDAMNSCGRDKECEAIHDFTCDKKGPFTACRGIGNISDHAGVNSSCIYKKLGNILNSSS